MNPGRLNFRRFLPVLAALAAWAGPSTAALACSVCQGNPDSELTKGAAAGVILMVAVTYALLLGFVGIIVSWIVRARRMP